jgi:hypothetical protein
MKQHFLFVARMCILCLLVGGSHPVFAQFARQHIQYSPALAVQASEPDSVYTIRERWFQTPRLQKGEERTKFLASAYSVRYTPELKSKFAAYPAASKELAASERYHLKSARWMQLAVTSGLAALALTIATTNNRNASVDRVDLGLTVISLGAIIPGVFYSVRSEEHRENAVKHLNLRQ